MQLDKDYYFVLINANGKVTIPVSPSPGIVEYVEIHPDTVKDWPEWLLGQSVKREEIILYD